MLDGFLQRENDVPQLQWQLMSRAAKDLERFAEESRDMCWGGGDEIEGADSGDLNAIPVAIYTGLAHAATPNDSAGRQSMSEQ